MVNGCFPHLFLYDTHSVATYNDYIIIGLDYSYLLEVSDEYLMGLILKREKIIQIG